MPQPLTLRCLCGALQLAFQSHPPFRLRHLPACQFVSAAAQPLFLAAGAPDAVTVTGPSQWVRDVPEAGQRVLVCAQCKCLSALEMQGALHVAAGALEGLAGGEVLIDGPPPAAWFQLGAVPSRRPQRSQVALTGRCGCGAVTIATRVVPSELQHCYCSMCRRTSGAPCATWAPISDADLMWGSAGAGDLLLMRTSSFARRHTCARCGSTLSIVYDAQPGGTWLAAGALQLPSNEVLLQQLSRAVHICVASKPEWVVVPSDGLARLANAC